MINVSKVFYSNPILPLLATESPFPCAFLAFRKHEPSGPKAGASQITQPACCVWQPSHQKIVGAWQTMNWWLSPWLHRSVYKFWNLFIVFDVFHSLVLEHDVGIYCTAILIYCSSRYTYVKQNHFGGNKSRVLTEVKWRTKSLTSSLTCALCLGIL